MCPNCKIFGIFVCKKKGKRTRKSFENKINLSIFNESNFRYSRIEFLNIFKYFVPVLFLIYLIKLFFRFIKENRSYE